MDITQIIQAIIIGIVEGLTEFLPVSSTGHIILFKDILGFEAPPGFVFEISIQLGSMLAICWKFRQKLIDVAAHPLRLESQRFVEKILLAFLPAMIIGAFAYELVREYIFTTKIVGIFLILGGIAIIVIESLSKVVKFKTVDDIKLTTALKIGLIQNLALIPGVSRSAATIMGALMLGVERKAAAEFSFFLGIPTILGATVYTMYKNWKVINFDDVTIIAIGFISAFLAGLAVVDFMIKYVSKHGFKPFAYYRIVVGSAILVWQFI